MRGKSIFFAFFILAGTICAQQITCSPANKQAVENKLIEIDGLLEKDFGTTMVAIGKTFIGTPYVAKTLEIGEIESLVVNLQGLDCTTFVENVLAFGLLLKGKDQISTPLPKTLKPFGIKMVGSMVTARVCTTSRNGSATMKKKACSKILPLR